MFFFCFLGVCSLENLWSAGRLGAALQYRSEFFCFRSPELLLSLEVPGAALLLQHRDARAALRYLAAAGLSRSFHRSFSDFGQRFRSLSSFSQVLLFFAAMLRRNPKKKHTSSIIIVILCNNDSFFLSRFITALFESSA